MRSHSQTQTSPLFLAWLTALWLGTLCNWPLWKALLALPEINSLRGGLFLLAFAGMITGVLAAILSVAAWRRVIKPVAALLLISAAAGAHFMGTYGVVIDDTMIVNVLQTDARETRDLLSLRMLVSFVVLAGLPLLYLWRARVKSLGFGRQLLRNLGGVVLGLVLAVALALASFADLAATMRNHKSLRYLINPLNSYYALGMVAFKSSAKPKGPPQVVGADAKLVARPASAKPPLLLLVVGETARARNFSLNGYARPTNPELAKLDVLSFRDVTSCGTSTAASLPCMFSHLGREEYGKAKGLHQESLLDVLQRAGLAVLWLDNQSGCKGICERTPNAMASDPAPGAPALPAGLCDGEECLDGALLQGLDQRLAALPAERRAKGVVLVLHQMGSHGPAYYKRSPADRKPFQPECKTNVLQQCEPQQLINAYDNSIAYADHVLAQAIAWVKQRAPAYDAALWYMSDHGESLGENNLYLHGMPYAFAPREQTHIPMVLWLPEAGSAVAKSCMRGKLDQPLSHDNLFHSVLGLMGVQTSIYQRDRDFFASCKAQP
nr:phosphoethanolamine--lipid A transferase [uncultured Roseateles sp.]